MKNILTYTEFINEAKIDKDLDMITNKLNDLNLKGSFERWGLSIMYTQTKSKKEIEVLTLENSRHSLCTCFPGDTENETSLQLKMIDLIITTINKIIKEKIGE